jgi:NAD(P)-dependent dehydrogenase (short-subunit alcohol dehydrogenase family)
MAIPQTILVTGVNRGMRFSTVQGTALRNSIATYILTYRTPSSRQAVILKLQKLRVTAGLDVVELDITNHATIISAKKYMGKKYGLLMVGPSPFTCPPLDIYRDIDTDNVGIARAWLNPEKPIPSRSSRKFQYYIQNISCGGNDQHFPDASPPLGKSKSN